MPVLLACLALFCLEPGARSLVPQGSAQNLTTTGKGHRHFFLSRYSAPVKQGRVSRFCSSGEESEADSEGSSCSWQ